METYSLVLMVPMEVTSRLAIGTYDSTNSVGQILQVGASSTVTWSNTLDGVHSNGTSD